MNWSGPVWDFYRLMGAVLAANLLTVAFVWAVISYSRMEQDGRAFAPAGRKHLWTVLLVFGFLAFGMLASGFFDGLFS